MNKTQQKKIDEIIENFDFEKIHRYMVFSEWHYCDHIPSLEEIRQVAKSLLESVEGNFENGDDNIEYLRTGGFEARRYVNGSLQLDFVIETWTGV